MDSPVQFDTEDGIGVITIDSPPVNALSLQVFSGLAAVVAQFEQQPALRALVICCAGRTFVAGGDLRTFDDPDFDATIYNSTLARIESFNRPVVAALHGTALGGGLELALACHYRVALPGTKVGLPEVTIGVIPGSLGTQRLPRLVPVVRAVEMMRTGRPILATQAVIEGLVDAVEEAGSSRLLGLHYARQLLAQNRGPRRSSSLPVRAQGLESDFFEQQLADVAVRQGAYPAARAVVESIWAGVRDGFEAGEREEARLFDACRRSRESRALRHLFFARREAARIPGLPAGTRTREVRKVGVVGAGVIGRGIAMSCVDLGLPVVVVETNSTTLERGLGTVRSRYEANVANGQLSATDSQERLDRLTGSLRYEDLSDCDLVIEAVFEDMALKQGVLARLGQVCRPGAIIASSTATLDIDFLAQASGRTSDVLGTHFIGTAEGMKIVEVVRGAATAGDVLLTIIELSKRIGKPAVVCGVCHGFIGNRMAERYMQECKVLLMEGATPAQIDAAVEDPARVGMATGPCPMLEMAGTDVTARTRIEREKADGVGAWVRRDAIAPNEIVERLMLPLINEAAKILEEGIALRPGDIDIIWTAGYGFPDHRGGPLWMADDWGLSHVVDRLRHYGSLSSDADGYWTPSPLLVGLAQEGRRISDYLRA